MHLTIIAWLNQRQEIRELWGMKLSWWWAIRKQFNALQYNKYSLPVAWESGQDSSSVSSVRETDHKHLDWTED